MKIGCLRSYDLVNYVDDNDVIVFVNYFIKCK